MPTDLNTAMDELRKVQLKTRPQDGMHPIRQAEQIKEIANDLLEHHPDDVREACKLWPRHNREFPDLASLLDMIEGQKRQRLARERRPGRERRGFDLDDPWRLPFGYLGIGLQVVRGQFLLAVGAGEAAVPQARRAFNRVVLALGLPEARRIADGAYRPGGDHETVRRALEDALDRHGTHATDIEGTAA